LSFYQVPILLAAGVIAAVSVSMSLVGLELGDRLGARFETWSGELGGGVLVLVGLALAVGLL
jgi:putative Mn2+ efflux pump MntP